MRGRLRNFWERIHVSTRDVPQANRLHQILDFVCGIHEWPTTPLTIAEYLGYEERQGRYYADAADLLGFISQEEEGWILTKRGEAFCGIDDESKRIDLLREFVIEIPIVVIALKLIELKGSKGTTIDNLNREMEDYTDLDESTRKRRTECIVSWLDQLDLIEKQTLGKNRIVHHMYILQEKLI